MGKVLMVAVAALVAMSAACAVNQKAEGPGKWVTPDFAQQWGCDSQEVLAKAEQLEDGIFKPEVGWTSCDLMAHRGRPVAVDQTQTQDGYTATWWYEQIAGNAPDAFRRRVDLALEGSVWIVQGIGY